MAELALNSPFTNLPAGSHWAKALSNRLSAKETSTESVNTDDSLQRKFSKWFFSPSGFRMCSKEVEDIDHTFLHCSFAYNAGMFLAEKWGFLFVFPPKKN